MRKKLPVCLMAAGAALIAAALLLMAYNQRADARAAETAETLVHTLAGLIPSGGAPSPGTETAAEIDGAGYIGTLSVPALALELPVSETCDETSLKTSPGRYAGSVAEGNLVIAGHNYSSHFGGLSRLTAGDEVRFTAAGGHVYRYEVAKVEILAPTAVTEMTDSGYALTLYTCTYGGQSRVTARCVPAGAE